MVSSVLRTQILAVNKVIFFKRIQFLNMNMVSSVLRTQTLAVNKLYFKIDTIFDYGYGF